MSAEGATAVASAAASDGLERSSAVRAFARKHGAGIAMAVLLAAVLVAPRWWTFVIDSDGGVRVHISPYAAGAVGYDETLYTASIREAFDGQFPVRDPFLVNHRDDGAPQRSAIPHTIIGMTGRVVGGPFSALAIVTTIAAVAALALLYALMLTLTGSRFAALALMPVVLFAIHVLNFADGFLPLRHTEILGALARIDPHHQVHAWARFPAPILVLAPFFVAVLALPKAVEGDARGWIIAAAAAIALLIYTYVYYWTALGLALVALLTVLWVRGEHIEARRLLSVGLLALLLALPELIAIGWAALSLPADARDRVGLEPAGIDKSLAMVITQRLLVGAPFVIALLRRGATRDLLYVGLFMTPLVLAPVQGLMPQQWHFQTQVWGVFAIPGFVAGGAAIASSLRWPEAPRVAYAAAAIIAVGAAAYVIVLQARAVTSTADGFVLSDDEHAAFEWMRDHLNDGDTVVSPSVSTNLLLASLTPASQYLADGGFTYAEDLELSERMLRVQAAYGYTEDDVMRRVNLEGEFEGFPHNDPDPGIDEQERLLEDHLAFFMFSFGIDDRDAFTERAEQQWRPRYGELLTTSNPLAAYPADYVYCGHRERYYGGSDVAPGTSVRLAFAQGDVALYELVGEGADGAQEFAGCGS